jgi:hypothetical protein
MCLAFTGLQPLKNCLCSCSGRFLKWVPFGFLLFSRTEIRQSQAQAHRQNALAAHTRCEALGGARSKPLSTNRVSPTASSARRHRLRHSTLLVRLLPTTNESLRRSKPRDSAFRAKPSAAHCPRSNHQDVTGAPPLALAHAPERKHKSRPPSLTTVPIQRSRVSLAAATRCPDARQPANLN